MDVSANNIKMLFLHFKQALLFIAQHHKHTNFVLQWNTLIWSKNDWMSHLIYLLWKIAKQLIVQVCVANSKNREFLLVV